MNKQSIEKQIRKKQKKTVLFSFARLPAHEMRFTIPTLLTIIRIFLTFVILTAMIFQYWGIAFVLFLVAAFTDILDGSLARFWNEKTFLGACLDPIADKFLVLSIFFTLTFVQQPLFEIPLWFVVMVFIKELTLITGSFFIYYKTSSLKINPTWLGKLAMFIQTVFIAWLFACYFFSWVPVKTYYAMLGMVILCAFASLVHYGWIGIKSLFF